MEELEHCILPSDRIEEAAALAAAAFDNSPIYNVICGPTCEPTFRQSFLQWLFEHNFRQRIGTDVNRCVLDSNGKLVAFFMFVSPDTPDVSLWDMIRAGMLKGLFQFGFGVAKRLVLIKNEYELTEDIVLKKNGHKPIYRLERMVVHPDHQGKGIGSIALKHALKDADDKDLQVMLSTQEERNVRFYERLGFEVVQETILAGHTNWVMIRNRKSEDN